MVSRKVAMYVRLSRDDKNSGSISLETQEKIIREKIQYLPEYQGEDPVLFSDNGYSGRNLDRPSISKLLEMVKKNEIACIIIKDFSRLSRDMLQVGYLVESVFPLFQTRFISINDAYDSVNYYEDTGGINVTFKYLLAEYYSRDLSKKIKAGKQAKIKRGEHVLKNPVFGYVLDENRRFIIDEGAAKIIRYIFKLAVDGKSVAEIRKNLYENKIPTRGEYKKFVLGYDYTQQPLIKGVWEHSCVMKVLRNEQYIGTYVGGRSVAKNDGTRDCRKTHESEWVRIPDQHPPIIDKETFAKVQALHPRIIHKIPVPVEFPLKRKVFCGCCGHSMSRVGKKTIWFKCVASRDLTDFQCSHLSINEIDLHKKILEILKEKASKILNVPKKKEKKPEKVVVSNEYVIKKRQLYEDYTSNLITKEVYLEYKQKLDEQFYHMNYSSSDLENDIIKFEKEKADMTECIRIARLVKKSKSLTMELCDLLIKKVLYFQDGKVELEFLNEEFATLEGS